MARQVLIIHGWSDTSHSFHSLAAFLAGHGYAPKLLWLGDYISRDDDVRVEDATEQSVMQALLQLGKEKTIVIVTHKLQLLSFVERVIVIDAGVRVADGPKNLVMQALSEGRVKGGPRAVPNPGDK